MAGRCRGRPRRGPCRITPCANRPRDVATGKGYRADRLRKGERGGRGAPAPAGGARPVRGAASVGFCAPLSGRVRSVDQQKLREARVLGHEVGEGHAVKLAEEGLERAGDGGVEPAAGTTAGRVLDCRSKHSAKRQAPFEQGRKTLPTEISFGREAQGQTPVASAERGDEAQPRQLVDDDGQNAPRRR